MAESNDRWEKLTPTERNILTNALSVEDIVRNVWMNIGMVEGGCDKSTYQGVTQMLALRSLRADLHVVLAKLEGGCNGTGEAGKNA